MFGFVGGYLNIPLSRLVEAASGTKESTFGQWFFGEKFLGYDNEAFQLGLAVWNRLGSQSLFLKSHSVSSSSFCRVFRLMAAKYPQALREAIDSPGGLDYGDYHDLSKCKPCPYPTFEKRHGGFSPPMIAKNWNEA